MGDYVPFINSEADCRVLKQHFGDARACRISLSAADRLRSYIPAEVPLWIDPGTDAYHHFWGDGSKWPLDISSESPSQIQAKWPRDTEGKREDEWKFKLWRKWEGQFNSFHAYRLLADEGCGAKKHADDLDRFVAEVLDACLKIRPKWISIPQLPVGKRRSKVNRRLSEATGSWRIHRAADAQLILPLIITTASTLARKPSRDRVLDQAVECYKVAEANGIWVVDTSLSDRNRSESFSSRYEKLIEFHETLRRRLGKRAIVIAGPYWGINLVLWARGLSDYPATSLGTTYTYHISCGQPKQGNVRLAIPPLRRWAVVNTDLFDWINGVLEKLSPADSVYNEFLELRQKFKVLKTRDAAANQVARFFSEWFHSIETISPEGRSLALYQELSSAYVLGRQLDPLPKTVVPQGSVKILEAGKVAEQLMLHCL